MAAWFSKPVFSFPVYVRFTDFTNQVWFLRRVSQLVCKHVHMCMSVKLKSKHSFLLVCPLSLALSVLSSFAVNKMPFTNLISHLSYITDLISLPNLLFCTTLWISKPPTCSHQLALSNPSQSMQHLSLFTWPEEQASEGRLYSHFPIITQAYKLP